MLRKISSSILLGLMTTLCACGASIDEYKNLSKAGQMYSLALENLLIKSGQITIDRTSEDLLVEDISRNNITRSRYFESSKETKLTLKSLQRLITQTRLLKSYFNQLEILANSDSAVTASSRATSIGGNISKLSGNIKNQEVILKDFIPSFVKISISANIRQSLRNELSIRGKTILEALEIQEKLISALREQINSDVMLIAEAREARNVVPPIISVTPIGNPDEWIKLRRDTLTYNQTINELTEASQSLNEFKDLFKAILEDKVTSARIESFLKETDDFIKIVEKNKTKVQEAEKTEAK
jgi:hypothetical protein